MTHVELTGISMLVHGPVLLAAIGAFFRWGSVGDYVSKSLAGVGNTVRQVRHRLALQLEDHLSPLFRDPGSVPQPFIEREGGTYIEKAVNPVGSEEFRQLLRNFVDSAAESIADYRSLNSARAKLQYWTKVRSWVLFILMLHEVVALGLSAAEKFLGSFLPDPLLHVFFFISATAVVVVFLAIGMVLKQDAQLACLRGRYDEWIA